MKGSILNKTIVHFFTNVRNNSIKKNPCNFVNRPKKKTAIRHDKIRWWIWCDIYSTKTRINLL